MGGQVLEFKHDIEIREAKEEGKYSSVICLIESGYTEEEACKLLHVDAEDFQKYKNKKRS
jgi:hypothetical protein